MAFKYYINSQLVDEPIRDKPLTTKIKYVESLNSNIITQECSLRWYKENSLPSGVTSGYSVIKTLFDDFICNEAEIEIYDEVSETETFLTFKGVIKIPTVTFDEERHSLATPVQDNSLDAYVFNNKDLKVDFRATQTKNNANLSPISLDYYTVDMFNGCDGGFGSSIGAYYKGYLIQDVFAFIIEVITDQKVSFQSDYLDALERPIIMFKGQSLLNSFTIYPTAQDPIFEVSFQDLFTEINVNKNLFIRIDATDPASPVLRIEKYEDRFGVDPIYTINEPLELSKRVDTEGLYGQVDVGSEITVDGADIPCLYTMNEAISYFGFKKEPFYPLGQCNRNTTLRLVNTWIVSNNVIQDIVVGSADQYVDDYVLVECDGLDTTLKTANAYPYDFFGQATPPFFYNLGLNNYNKLQRHSSKFETVFGNFMGMGGLGFRALLGDDPTQDITYVTAPASAPNFIPIPGLQEVAEFVNETTSGGFDGSNNYSPITFHYTIPTDGNYSFHHQLHIEISGTNTDYFNVTGQFILYDALNNVKAQQSLGMGGFLQNGEHILDATWVADAITTDYVEFRYFMTFIPNQGGNLQNPRTLTVIWDSFIETNGTPDGGISIASGNRSIKKLLYDLTDHISQTDWRVIMANPTGYFQIIKNDQTISAWAEDVSHNDQTGETKLILRSQNDATI